ncbi:type II secretion system protein [Hyphomonas polymorpha PS728]|uniref:Type II secretion system protein n=1 Tax=Hyphomonas polymorpha PS728 TaxID=1280954 RepID=A0A062VF41_9PROT|nr:secretin N-terminal domain-containing protein [Hyphomonas polymorpha]KCZ97127.1 type II secretion system protein [Hyphomonas polymorpha PS728]
MAERFPETWYGSERFLSPAPDRITEAPRLVRQGEARSFMFRDAPIDAVVNQILGTGFGLNYVIDPAVSGTITLRLEDISDPAQAVAALTGALQLQGLGITEKGGIYVVAPLSREEAAAGVPAFIQTTDLPPAGTSLAVLQLKHARVEDVSRIATAMLPPNTIRHGDESRGLIVLSGSPDTVAVGVEILKSLDVNWLSSVSSALVPIKHARPSEISADLAPAISNIGGATIIPVDRLDALFITARQRETVDQLIEWIRRLDRDASPQRMSDLLVYEARYVNAGDLMALTGGTSPGMRNTPAANDTFSTPGGSFGDPSQSGASLYAGLSIKVDPGRNAIIARGNTEELTSLGELLSLLDKPKKQVLIQATIVEVGLTDTSSLGVQWDLVQDQLSARFTEATNGSVSGLFPGVSVSYINTDIKAVINALATTGDVEIVSSPRMLVLNNETARLQIGDQVPVITQSAVSVTNPDAPIVNSTTYRDTGVTAP